MAFRGKRYREALGGFDRGERYGLDDALGIIANLPKAKFDETVEISVKLGVDPKHADQMVRGTVVLPHGTGKELKVLVLAQGEKQQEAKESGADYVGADDLIEKIGGGWFDFDIVIATPDMMGKIGKLGRILGPKGLMPNPKSGTVTMDVGKAVGDAKAGRVEFRVDKEGNLHVPVGKVSFPKENLTENLMVFLDAVVRAKPPAARGLYIRSMTLSSTMGPGVRLDRQRVLDEL